MRRRFYVNYNALFLKMVVFVHLIEKHKQKQKDCIFVI